MKVGDKIVCPYCGEMTFVKKESVLDGWKKTGEYLKCALCSHKLAEMETGSEKPAAESSERLRNLLGGETLEKPKNDLSDSECRFCKDCRHMVVHPFQLRCGLHQKPVESMDDCPDFQKRITPPIEPV